MWSFENAGAEQDPADAADAFDPIEADFSGLGEPALDIGPADAVEEPLGRSTGGSLGRVRHHGARAFGARVSGARTGDFPAA